MTDDELDDVYFQAFNANWRKTGRGDSSDTAGLRAVADAAERRALDLFEHYANNVYQEDFHKADLLTLIDEMREELDRGDG
jgi:hypothetical protein